jgi:hypothetical protein
MIKQKGKLTIQQAMKAQSASRGIILLLFNLGTRYGLVVNATPGRLSDPLPIVQEAG